MRRAPADARKTGSVWSMNGSETHTESGKENGTKPASADGAADSDDVRLPGPDELRGRLKGHSLREALKHALFAVVMGVVGAFASILLCLTVDGAYSLFQQVPWAVWILPVFGLASLALYRAFGLPLDLTTHRVMNLMRQNKPISPFLAPGILLGTAASNLGGASVGKEAAALQMGASLGSLVARPFKLHSVYKKNVGESMEGYAAATGMAAAFSALFFAPLGAAMFVMELARFKRSINKHIVSIVLACEVAFLIAHAIGIGDSIQGVPLPQASWELAGQCVIVGVVAAVVGGIFSSATDWLHDLTWKISKNCHVWVVVGGVLFACLVTFCGWDSFTGGGGDALKHALEGSCGPWDFAVKALLTVICLGFWFKGGEIMPALCVGGLLGASCTVMSGGDVGFGAAIGSMALFAGFTGCPLAAFLMGCEIFGWHFAPWLAIAIGVTALANPTMGMYGAGLDDAIRARWKPVLKGSYRRLVEERELEAAQEGAAVPGAIADVQDALTAIDATLKEVAKREADEMDPALMEPPDEKKKRE